MIISEQKYLILVVDDEPDMHALSRLSLKKLSFRGQGVEMAFASTGREAVEFMREHPETAVILLDVVMETSSAGLDACQTIRQEIGNDFVRILLRTGQPGAAPEKKVIDEYDIDGYLAKAELTSNRLYTTVRTALKAYSELLDLQRHREVFNYIHESITSLHLLDGLDASLQQIIETAVIIAPTDLAVLNLETFAASGELNRYLLYTATDVEPTAIENQAKAIVSDVNQNPGALALQEAGVFGKGFLIPLSLNQELGHGWLYIAGENFSALELQALPILATHATNALYQHLYNEAKSTHQGFYTHVSI